MIKLLHGFRRGILPQDHEGGASGSQIHQKQHEKDEYKQRRKHQEYTSDQVFGHLFYLPMRSE
jgi:hypothetical protein